MPTFGLFWGILTSKLGQTYLVLVIDQSSLVALFVQDYKCLWITVMICLATG